MVGYLLLEGADLVGRQVAVIQALQDRPLEGVGVPLLVTLFLANLVQLLGEVLRYVEKAKDMSQTTSATLSG